MILVEFSQIWLSYSILRTYSLSDKDFGNWSCRKNVVKTKRYGLVYIAYNTIPAPSRAKLPSELELRRIYEENKISGLVQFYLDGMENAIRHNYGQHYNYIAKKYTLSSKQKQLSAERWASIEWLLSNIRRGEQPQAIKAFNKRFDTDYCQSNFSRVLGNVRRKGIEAVAVDGRAINTGHAKIYSQEIWDRVLFYVMNDRKFSSAHIRTFLLKDFKNQRIPSDSMIKINVRKMLQNNEVYAKRFGIAAAKAQLPYNPLMAPEKTNIQWQIDGWTLPFWVNGKKSMERWTIVRVIDACSRKILGYRVAKSEDIKSIIGALEDAVRNTGQIPKELIMDKHSASKTNEFTSFIEVVEKLGCKVIATLNPQSKAYIERHNQYLDRICKEYPEWLGQGISSKKPIRRSPEAMKELAKTKNQLSPNEVVARGLIIVEKFNQMELKPIGNISPSEKYQSTHSGGITVDDTEMQKIFRVGKQYTVRHGMIEIKRGVSKNTYMLPTEYQGIYNGKKVMVHWEDWNDGIYVYEMGKDSNYICYITPIPIASNSTTLRKEPMKAVGVSQKAQSRDKDIIDGLKENPDSAAFMPSYLINKSAYQEIRQNEDLQRAARIAGIDIDKLENKTKHKVHVVGERPKYTTPEMEDDSYVDLKPINIYQQKNNG